MRNKKQDETYEEIRKRLSQHKRFEPDPSNKHKELPRGSKGRKKVLEKIMFQKLKDDKTVFDLVFQLLRNEAIKGSPRAGNYIDKLRDTYIPFEAEHKGGFLIVPEPKTMEEARVKLEEHRLRTIKDLKAFRREIETKIIKNKKNKKLDLP